MTTFTIGNACNIPLNLQAGTIPNLGSAMLDWFQYITFGQVSKTVSAFQVDEVATDINFWGIIQPLSGRQLMMKPEGQRRWNWISVHAQASPAGAVLSLTIDDVIIWNGKQYRVMTRKDYALYSFVYYEFVEDYTQAGPPTP